jgi:hypothetical protein
MADKATNNEHLENLLAYLANKLPSDERYRFERESECDPFDYEALDGFKQLSLPEIQKDLRSLKLNAPSPLPFKSIKMAMWGLVGVVAVFALVFLIRTISNRPPKLTDNKPVSNTISPVDSSLFKSELTPEEPNSGIQNSQPDEATTPEEPQQVPTTVAGSDQIISYRGIIVNVETKRPMPGVEISVKNSSRQTVTGYDGSFSLDLAESTHPVFIARFDGMEEKQFLLKEKAETIYISPENIEKPADQVPMSVRTNRAANPEFTAPAPSVGMARYEEYLSRNQKYPEGISNPKVEEIHINFLVKTTGQPIKLQVTKTPGQAFTQEAIRLVLDGPKWNPAIVNGNPSVGDVSLKITFVPRR